jgi:Zn-dependent protease with chaperone function
MSGFVLGSVIGLFAGAIATLLLLRFVSSIPDGELIRAAAPAQRGGNALIVALLLASGVLFLYLDLRRVAFATSLLLLVVLVTAHLRGILVSWIMLAVAVLLLALLLPPTARLQIADRQDQILEAFFLVCGVLGTRMVAQDQPL